MLAGAAVIQAKDGGCPDLWLQWWREEGTIYRYVGGRWARIWGRREERRTDLPMTTRANP